MKIEGENKVIEGTNLTKGQIFVHILDRNLQRSEDPNKDFGQLVQSLKENGKPNLMTEEIEEEDSV